MYDNKDRFDQLHKMLEDYNQEYLFMRIHMREVRRHTQNENKLLTIVVDQLSQTVSVNIFDRTFDKEVFSSFYRFRKPLFKKLTNELFRY